jgi:hypothetical protein
MQGGICDQAAQGVTFEPAGPLGDVTVRRVNGDVAFVALHGAHAADRPVTLTVTFFDGRWGVDSVVGMRLPGRT